MFISQAKLNRLKRLEGRTNKKGQPLAISNFANSVIELDNIMQQITITKRKEITKAAEPIALAAYRNLVPNSNKLHKFYIKGKGLKGREWALSDEAGFTGEKMGQRIINYIDELFLTWKPRKNFELINTKNVEKRVLNHKLQY